MKNMVFLILLFSVLIIIPGCACPPRDGVSPPTIEVAQTRTGYSYFGWKCFEERIACFENPRNGRIIVLCGYGFVVFDYNMKELTYEKAPDLDWTVDVDVIRAIYELGYVPMDCPTK